MSLLWPVILRIGMVCSSLIAFVAFFTPQSRAAHQIGPPSSEVLESQNDSSDEANAVADDVVRPNVLVIIADDQGWGDLSLHGNSNLQTPTLDALALQGAQFDRFFVCPVCAPTRAEFLTGRYHPRSNVMGVSRGLERLDTDESTIADSFRTAGYATAAFGKWHSGTQYPYHPRGRGFDEFYGFCSGHWGNYFSPMLDHNGQVTTGNGYVTNDFTDRAIQFMSPDRDDPFFIYLGYCTPHSPMQVPDRWWQPFADKTLDQRGTNAERENLDHTRAALAMVENIDWNVARLLKHLEDTDQSNDTIVVYLSDNGPNGNRFNGGMRGIKGSTDEGGVRSPLFIRYPRKIPAGRRVNTIASAIDLLPTLTNLARIPANTAQPVDGISMADQLTLDEPPPSDDRKLFSHWNQRISVRTQRYRLDDKGRLYDMQTDPGQTQDVADREPTITANLRQSVDQWRANVLTPALTVERPFTVAGAEFRWTQLPARDGQATGGIKRSNKYPNCTFFENWTQLDEQIFWPVKVSESGTYRARLLYSCSQSNVGCRIRLVAGDNQCEATVSVAHDPPLKGMENDRIVRQESYVKDFAELDLGQIDLSEEIERLELTATNRPGDGLIDVRMLILGRQP
jgi:arylsulfatase A-like enzyme